MNSSQPPSVKHSAAGPYLGFALQPVRLCYHLLCSPLDASVSLEHLDDVAVHYADGTVLVEQCKSALSHNALSDWSGDLWKTIANWLLAVHAKKIDRKKTTFQLYVTPIRTGKISSALHAATSADAVLDVTNLVRQKLAKKAEPPKCMESVQDFLDATEDERCSVVQRMSVLSNDDDPLDALRTLLAPTVPNQLLDIICEAAIGMAKEWADRRIRKNLPAIIQVAEFRRTFHAFVQRNNLVGYLPSFSAAVTPDEAAAVLKGRPTFVRQLELVEATEEQQLRAVSDFLRTSGDKTKWAENGFVFEGSFAEWEGSLIRRHSAIRGEIEDLHGDKAAAVRGRTIYNRCSGLDIQLDSRTVPGHFTHGGYNDLADRLELGWHPQYEALLKGEDEK